MTANGGARGAWRAGAALAAVLALAVAVQPVAVRGETKPDPSGLEAQSIEVTARVIAAFDPRQRDRVRFGKLEFRGGLELKSSSAGFGGWSGLALDPQGRRLVAISDTGVWMTGELIYEAGRLSAIGNARLGPLLGLDGRPLKWFRDRDAEGFALLSGTLAKGEGLVSFEGNHRILRYLLSEAGLGVPTEQLALPSDVKRMNANKSLESVCVMKAGPSVGAVVTLAERFPSATPDHVGWLRSTDGRWRTLAIEDIDDFYPTDCLGLDDGGMLVLERRFRLLDGVRMRLRRFTPEEIAGGGVMAGEILIEASKEQQIDNMEGLAAHRGPDGELIVTMISDDNFNPILQRTVLLQFALPPQMGKPADETAKSVAADRK